VKYVIKMGSGAIKISSGIKKLRGRGDSQSMETAKAYFHFRITGILDFFHRPVF
jgi:hypothetical protein